ncbi:ROK family transcriptional regulator, partial [Aquabacterium sp.]|uniref:ROK family transcriptional regulator n=1 Tax=Aquabacterium sp. TaxID=1872578 RepID=UPI0025BD3CEF
NERVVLQAIRMHGALPKAELARLTHLSAQTVSIIIERLLDEDLVLKQQPLRGKVGQPSVPIALNPDGAFSVGIKVGRRSMDALLVDFTGRVRERLTLDYAWPDPDTLFDAIANRVEQLRTNLAEALGAAKAERLQGVGVAAPFSLGGWQTLLGMPESKAATWQSVHIPQRMQGTTDLPVHFVKDTSAACVAELVAGRGRNLPTFLYIFVDTFIGGGLVIDSHLRGGVHGNAGAVGSLPLNVVAPEQPQSPAQLLSLASLVNLEQGFERAGLDPTAAYDERALQGDWAPVTAEWVAQTARGMALAINSTACLLDLEGVIIDGSFSRGLLAALLPAVQQAMGQYNWEGVFQPSVLGGTIGSDARAIGGALMPLYANFAPDRELFLKLGA